METDVTEMQWTRAIIDRHWDGPVHLINRIQKRQLEGTRGWLTRFLDDVADA
jgi:hypothetical protein